MAHAVVARFAHGSEGKFSPGGKLVVGNHSSRLTFYTITKQEIRMSSTCSVPPRDLVSVEFAAKQVGAHPQTLLTRSTFRVRYPVRAPERGPQMANPRPTPKPGNLGPPWPPCTSGNMSSTCSALPRDLVSVEVAAEQVGAHPQTLLTRSTFPVHYPVLAPERGARW